MANEFFSRTTVELRFGVLGFIVALTGVGLGFLGFAIPFRGVAVAGFVVCVVGVVIGFIAVAIGVIKWFRQPQRNIEASLEAAHRIGAKLSSRHVRDRRERDSPSDD